MSEAAASRPAVSVDPTVLAGTPCLAGTRIPTHLIASTTWHEGVEQAKQAWNLTSHQVIVACWYSATHPHTPHTQPLEPKEEVTRQDTGHGDGTGPGTGPGDEHEWEGAWKTWAEAVLPKLWLGQVRHLPHPPRKPTHNRVETPH